MLFATVTLFGLFLGMPAQCENKRFYAIGECNPNPKNTPNYVPRFGHNIKFGKDLKVNEINILTYGVQRQLEIIADLKYRFGEPTIIDTDIMQNIFGAKFAVVHVIWIVENEVVEFYAGDLQNGMIKIMNKNQFDKEKAPPR